MRVDLTRISRRDFQTSRGGGKRKSKIAAAHVGQGLSLEPLEWRLLLTTVPVVLSINRSAPQNTSAAAVAYSVTFNESVTNVTGADFRLTTGGSVKTTTPLAVTGTGAAYTVTVSGIHGSGDLRLDQICEAIQN